MITQCSAQIDKITAKNDRTLSITIGTQEMSPSDSAYLFSLLEKQIWVAFAETQLTKEDLNIPEIQVEKGRKTPSQRLRDRMFVYWKEMKKEGKFDDWYEDVLEEIGAKYLSKLN
jgi:hypothetical protein